MSRTALAWLGLYSASLVVTWGNPIYGLMGVMLEYYKRPELQWWGDELPQLRWNFIATLVFGLSVIVRQVGLPRLPKVDKAVLTWGALFAINLWLVNLIDPIDRARALDFSIYWSKVALIMPLLLVLVLRSQRDIDFFILANVAGLALWGWDAYTDPERDASRLIGIGSGDTLNDNAAANHLVLMLPLIVAMVLDASNKLLRGFAAFSLVLTVNTLILCNSRGSIVGLATAMALIPLLAKKGHRARALGLGCATVVGFFMLADPEFIERQQTITSYEEDGSVQGRLEGWRQVGRIVSDYPLGVGARGFHVLIPKYSAELAERHQGEERAPHNTVIMVATEYGVAGIMFWLAFYAAVFWTLLKTRRLCLTAGNDGLYIRTVAITVGLVGSLVASLFSDRLYSEGIYWIVSMAIAVNRVSRIEHETARTAVVPLRAA